MKKKAVWIAVGVALIGGGVVWAMPLLRLGVAAQREGFFDSPEMRSYTPERSSNLAAISTALGMMYDSDGAFPDGKDWMDKLLLRLKVADMTSESAKLKLHRPDVAAGGYGYALNSLVVGKAKSQLKPTDVVVFESKSVAWNAVGDPVKDGVKGGKAILVDGSVAGNPSPNPT